jgi:hypothetical protein
MLTFSTVDFSYNNLFLQYNRKTRRSLCDVVRIRQHIAHVKQIRTTVFSLPIHEFYSLVDRYTLDRRS